jgi:prepilin-type N-terminal cleavage/methylation domain-containing protein/prepilin-type processing-associated H-X9-DG protein
MRLRRTSAFTLVELLVVIGIIAVLISILMPALAKAREQARLVQCGSNLRQIYDVFGAYADEYNGLYPAAVGYHGGWTPPLNLNNYDQYGDVMEVMQVYQENSSLDGGLWHLKEPIWICPSELNTSTADLYAGDLRDVSYFCNKMAWEGAYPYPIGAPQALSPDGTDWENDSRAIKPSRITCTTVSGGLSDVIMLCEGNFDGVDWSFYQNDPWQGSYLSQFGRSMAKFDQISFRHNQDYTKLNVLYFDGHVQSVNYKDCLTAFPTMLTWPDPYSH